MQSGQDAITWLIKRCCVTNGLAERTRQIAAAKYLALKQVFTQFPDYSTIGYAPAALAGCAGLGTNFGR
jgi:hypothetical protein